MKSSPDPGCFFVSELRTITTGPVSDESAVGLSADISTASASPTGLLGCDPMIAQPPFRIVKNF